MILFLKYLIRNIVEKKYRTMIILLSIAVASGLFFATQALTTTTVKNIEERDLRLTGTSDIIIQPLNSTNSFPYIDNERIKKYNDLFDYSIGVIESEVFYAPNVHDMMYIKALGIDLGEMEQLNPLSIYKQDELTPFCGNKIIISKYMSEKYNLPIGSTMVLEVAGEQHNVEVVAVAHQKGHFINETTGMVAVMPKTTLSNMMNADNQVNKMYIKLKQNASIAEVMTELEKDHEEYAVYESINPKQQQRSAAAATQPFKLVSILVFFVSMFIVCTAFNVIATERLPVIGTLRSVGATKNKVSHLLVSESIILGLIGGIIGCAVGIFTLNIIAQIYIPKITGAETIAIDYETIQFINCIVFAVILSVISSIIPIINRTYKSIREIMFGTMIINIQERNILYTIVVILLIVSIIIAQKLETNLISFIVSNVLLLNILISLVILVPIASKIIVMLLSKLRFTSNEMIVSLRNIISNKYLINNIRLIVISIASLLFIMTIAYSISENISNLYNEQFSYDIRMEVRQGDNKFAKQLSQVKGVKDFTNIIMLTKIDIPSHDYYINTLYGIEDEKFFKYHNMKLDSNGIEAVNELNQGRHVVIPYILKSKLKVQIGDTLVFDTNGKNREYVITGFVDTSFSKGDIAFISLDNMKLDTGLAYYSRTFVTADDDVEALYINIKEKFMKDLLVIRTIDEIEEINKAPLESTFDIIISYSILATVIGIVGIINNLIVSIIERKRYLAIYRSIGMSKRYMIKMLTYESFFTGIFGVVFGVIGAVAMISIMPSMLSFIYGEIQAFYNLNTFIVFSLTTIFLMILTSIIPVLKTSKMSIIESIKYE